MRPEHRRVIVEVGSTSMEVPEISDSELIESGLSGTEIKAETREKILKFQEEKQQVMSWLKEQLGRIKRGEQIELNNRNPVTFLVIYREGSFIATNEDQEFNVTLGELLTDGSWGIDYELDIESVPSGIAKQYVLSRAKARLRELLNQQLVLIGIETTEDDGHRRSFQAIRKRQIEGKRLLEQDKGFLAEEMVLNLMKKLSIDHGLPIKIEEADAYDDVVNKIDYIMHRENRDRGVDVSAEESDQEYPIGVQFTLMFRKKSMIGKAETVLKALRRGIIGESRVRDIALVNVHPAYIKRAVNKWKWKKNKRPGGPDACLEEAAKVDLIQKILKNLFSKEEIDEIITNTFGVDRHKIKIRKTY